MVAEAPAPLAVDDRGDVVDVSLLDDREVGARGVPEAPLTVEALHLTSLPRAVRVAESDVDVVANGEGLPADPLGSLVEGDRTQAVGRGSHRGR